MYDGGSNSHPQLRSISGSWSNIVPVVSSSNSLFVWFTSDISAQRKGFSVNYESRIKGTVTSIKQASFSCPVIENFI